MLVCWSLLGLSEGSSGNDLEFPPNHGNLRLGLGLGDKPESSQPLQRCRRHHGSRNVYVCMHRIHEMVFYETEGLAAIQGGLQRPSQDAPHSPSLDGLPANMQGCSG